MWVPFALAAAISSAGVSLLLKRMMVEGDVVLSTALFRAMAGVLLLGLVAATGGWPPTTPTYWAAVAMVIPPEVAGMLCLSLALRAGDLSLVQPVLGLLPLLVTIAGIFVLDEVPSPGAGVGVVLVSAGMCVIGIAAGGSLRAPFRVMARSRAIWYAGAATLFWTATTLLHKVGIAQVGPFPWAATLTLGSGLSLALCAPLLAGRGSATSASPHGGRWTRLVVLAALLFAVQQAGLHTALQTTHAGYVVAVISTSTLWASVVGILVLGERARWRHKIAGALLLSSGAAIIALSS